LKTRILLLLALSLLTACGQQKVAESQAAKPPLPEPWTQDPPMRKVEDCSAQFRFEPDVELSPEEYLQLLDPDASVEGRGEGRLTYRPFDYEDTIERDGWRGLGVVIARARPGAPKSVGGLLLVKPDASMFSEGGYEVGRAGDKLVLSVSVESVKLPDGPGKCAHPYRVTLDDRGVLVAGGEEIGRLQ
jgi:hypothetical protein